MSLIHDALRKAAAEDDENRHGQRGRPASWRDVEPPPPPPRSVWPWIAFTALLAIGLAGLAWLVVTPVRAPSPPAPAAAVAVASSTPAASAPVAVAAPRVAPTEALPPRTIAPPRAVVEPTTKPRTAEPTARGAAPAPSPSAPVPVPAPPAAAEIPALAAAGSQPKIITPPARTGQVGNDTFVLEAAVDGKTLRLDFIVWSDAPFAQINGRQVGMGQQVDGFLVTAIARDRVTLESPTRRIALKVR